MATTENLHCFISILQRAYVYKDDTLVHLRLSEKLWSALHIDVSLVSKFRSSIDRK